MADLISLSDFKQYKGIQSTTQDSRLNVIISTVSDYIKNYCGRAFIDYYDTWKTEYINDPNAEYFYLKEIPVIDVEYLKVSVDGGVTQSTWVENTDYFINYESGKVMTPDGKSFALTEAGTSVSVIPPHKCVEVKYKAGYLEVPGDIKQAALDLVEHYRDNEYTPSKSFAGSSVENTLRGNTKQLPVHISRILDMYREL